MSKRPTIADLASAAGVGVATVDRVLHGRANVSARTSARVAEAAERIGYHAAGLIAARQAPPAPVLRFGFVLHKQAQPFYRQFAQQIEAACAAQPHHDIRARIVFSPSQAPEDFAAAFERAAEGADAVAGSAINHPQVDRAIAAISATGTPCFALLNDFATAARRRYFGLDNLRTGRIAGWMIAATAPALGKVATFVGGSRWHGQVLRETGCRAALRDHAPGMQMLDTAVNLETRQVTYEATLDLLARHGDLRGIYVAGGGMEGAIAALRESRPPGKVALVVNELTADSRAALADGHATLAIATPLDLLCRDLVAAMSAAAGAPEDSTGPDRHLLEAHLVLPESV
ncbi:MAG: LacI family DNA-binding transcriptional regulator [Salibaculum sp.]|uniref:LacI family DNA-binding transcriptional regulator n=1 Tax=Salibaculum sp. TaxID=2855480 RepID=UPI00287097C8|nr:LacI family DNA-binding transcriptional regulator [Salibaculum sp.]MDR9429003.1 LacI family DNA-binding transcriptional regulator [Salibaculum sp.]